MAIDLQRPALDVAPSTPPSEAPESASPVETPVIHDDYCAIHDEYGTCTCGAAQRLDESSAEE